MLEIGMDEDVLQGLPLLDDEGYESDKDIRSSLQRSPSDSSIFD